MGSMLKTGNLLLTPAMQQVFLDMSPVKDNKYGQNVDPNLARKAYLSVLMVLPINKYTKPLKLKILSQLWTEESSESEDSY